MSSSSSSDTDEEEKQRLQESVLGFELETSKKSKVEKTDHVKKRPSMRISQEDEVRESILNTTPEFRSFVGKKLDAYFDSLLEDTSLNVGSTNLKETDKCSGIKLLKNSSVILKDTDDKIEDKKKKKRKKKYSSSSDDDEEMERIRSAAVSVDFVTKGSAIKQNTDGSADLTNEEEKKHKKKKKKSKKDIEEAVG